MLYGEWCETVSYVVVNTKQNLTTAQALRDYLIDAERLMPKSLRTANVHVWMANYANLIDEQARRELRTVVPFRRT